MARTREALLPALLLSTSLIGCSGASAPAASASPASPQAAETLQRGPRTSLFAQRWAFTDETGKDVSFSTWRGSTLVVAAIYTSCSTVCPRTVAKLRRVEDAFRRDARPVQFLLVTLDPTADTPARLRDYKESEKLPDSWHLLAGSTRTTQALTDLLDIHLIDMGSHIFHESNVAVFDAEGMPLHTFRGTDFDDAAAVR